MPLPRLIAFDLDGTIWTPEMYELWGGGGAPFRVAPHASASHAPRDQALIDRAHNRVTLLGESARILHELVHAPRWAHVNSLPSVSPALAPAAASAADRAASEPASTRVIVAWVSCCDEPTWADECLAKFTTDPSPWPSSSSLSAASSSSSSDSSCPDDDSKSDDAEHVDSHHDMQPVALSACVNACDSMIFKANKQTHFKRLRAAHPHVSFADMLFFDNDMSNIHSVSALGVKCVYTPDGMTRDVWAEGLRLFA
jgi:magnesium-dependent phosphatase 1